MRSFKLCIILLSAILLAGQAHADLSRLKRSIMRDCDGAEAIFDAAGLASPTAEDQPELIRYLGEVFKLNLSSQFEAPLVAGNLADPTDIWRSLSGESEVDSKLCAIRLVRRIGPSALDALAPAATLLEKATTTPELKCGIASAILELFGNTSVSVGTANFDESGLALRRALRELAARGPSTKSDETAASEVASMLLVYGLDSSVFAAPETQVTEDQVTKTQVTQTQWTGISKNTAGEMIGAPKDSTNEKTANVKPTNGKAEGKIDGKGDQKSDHRAIFRALASPSEEQRAAALSKLSESDLKALEGFRVSASRSEKVAASLAISHLGGKWLLDASATKSLDCSFASSFVPLNGPTDSKRRNDFVLLISRCLLVGREEFLKQIINDPDLADNPAIKAVAAPSPGLDEFSTHRELSILLQRLRPTSVGLKELVSAVCGKLNKTP